MERIIRQLEHTRGVTGWRIRHERKTGYQLYVIGRQADQIRKVITSKYFVTVYTCDGPSMGSTEIVVSEHELDHLTERLERAVFIAKRVRNPAFALPEPAEYPFVETMDPTLQRDIEDVIFVQLADRLIEIVEKEKDISLSSSEFFVDFKEIRLCNSRGVDVSWMASEIFFDGVLLAGGGSERTEVHFEPRARRMQDLPMEVIVSRHARYARDSLSAGLPVSGRYPVVLTGAALAGAFAPLIHHTSAMSLYRKSSALKPSETIFTQDPPEGETLTLISNGFIPFGLRTAPADPDGVPANRFELIREGVFVRPWSLKQYADYLSIPATGEIANLEIPIGRNAMADLMKSGERVLHVAAFSALMPDPVSGNFAAEIKTGYEYYKGEVRPVRGGSVSGNLLSCFNRAYYSTESQVADYSLSLDRFGSYIGPQAVRFETFQITGR